MSKPRRQGWGSSSWTPRCPPPSARHSCRSSSGSTASKNPGPMRKSSSSPHLPDQKPPQYPPGLREPPRSFAPARARHSHGYKAGLGRVAERFAQQRVELGPVRFAEIPPEHLPPPVEKERHRRGAHVAEAPRDLAVSVQGHFERQS